MFARAGRHCPGSHTNQSNGHIRSAASARLLNLQCQSGDGHCLRIDTSYI